MHLRGTLGERAQERRAVGDRLVARHADEPRQARDRTHAVPHATASRSALTRRSTPAARRCRRPPPAARSRERAPESARRWPAAPRGWRGRSPATSRDPRRPRAWCPGSRGPRRRRPTARTDRAGDQREGHEVREVADGRHDAVVGRRIELPHAPADPLPQSADLLHGLAATSRRSGSRSPWRARRDRPARRRTRAAPTPPWDGCPRSERAHGGQRLGRPHDGRLGAADVGHQRALPTAAATAGSIARWPAPGRPAPRGRRPAARRRGRRSRDRARRPGGRRPDAPRPGPPRRSPGPGRARARP